MVTRSATRCCQIGREQGHRLSGDPTVGGSDRPPRDEGFELGSLGEDRRRQSPMPGSAEPDGHQDPPPPPPPPPPEEPPLLPLDVELLTDVLRLSPNEDPESKEE